ncbi:hypothetical protein H634G_08548 [Metarhizium anisopliae BRIP 53293]|uniref:SSCRP protein n=1 Tax=Metarhizium anisopliae BRIP 53293 TaxID=1291518 RepID=A0A0D9NQ28_METAN|nr:hypothetical protein H634G_08548 [Metarhizium anisopliae BRIP 53293]KJK96046.1 hypothetical protein H633G_00081 [Metarhizium anisopliae BRIP 53284]
MYTFLPAVLATVAALASEALVIPDSSDNQLPGNMTELLLPRGGNHEAVIYSGQDCSGTDLGSWYDFGCGGFCASSNGQPIYSILLKQDTVGNPKPTAQIWSGSNCGSNGHTVMSAGIYADEHSGCTTLDTPGYSLNLYFNC